MEKSTTSPRVAPLRRARGRIPHATVALLVPLFACGSSSDGSDNGFGSTVDAGGGADGSMDASGSPVPDAHYGGDVFVLPMGDGATDGNSACSKLNIGILGLPGDDASSSFQTWLVSAGTSVMSFQTTATDPLTAAELAPFDVVILNKLQRDYTTAEAAIFATWVQNGGGVAAMSGFENNTTIDFHANTLLAPLEVAYADPFFEAGPVTSFASVPLTAGLTSVTFDGGYAVIDLGGTASTRTPIAYLPDPTTPTTNDTVGYQVTMGSGHAFVWGDEWIQFDSEWSTMPQIQQLWVQVFAFLAPPGAVRDPTAGLSFGRARRNAGARVFI